ncbi:MAG: sigma-54-dependent Fis family transcriptional regulator [Nitrospirae bacterium]|nr:sigma-54-dependent Fis family transcriptional regulator [Nitrospirota bacterium]
MKAKILVVDDERDICKALEFLLKAEGYSVTLAYSGEEAVERLKKEEFDVILTDLKMGGMDGIAVLERAKELNPEVSVLMMTAFASVESAVEAMKKGASDYIVKPFLNEEIRLTIKRVLEQRRLISENIALKQQLSQYMGCKEFVGDSDAMFKVFDTLQKVIPTRSNILILGESGTGKGLIAEIIHCNSPRRDKPFISLNCSAIPEGLLESELFGYKRGAFTGAVADKQGLITIAHEGTLFLDEIGDMPLSLQAKLLNVLESGEVTPLGDTRSKTVDVRIISATNTDIDKKIKGGSFREDLYYRLNVIEIKVPLLRERKGDIPLLINHFVRKFSEENKKPIKGVDASAMSLLLDYPWPGNVRELRNIIERAVVLCTGDVITPQCLPEKFQSESTRTEEAGEARELPPLRVSVNEFEKNLIMRAYDANQKNKEATAKALGIDLVTLYRKFKKLGIEG